MDLLDAGRRALLAAPPLDHPAYLDLPGRLADRLRAAWPQLRAANEVDLDSARARELPAPIVDRLRLDEPQLAYLLALTRSVRAALPEVLAGGPPRPAGSWGSLRAVPKPLGLVLMVYEARPTVTVEGALLAASVGNAVLLRGGRELSATNAALGRVVRAALVDAGLPGELVTVLDDPDRSVLRTLLARPDAVDVLIPRGSPSLIDYCRRSTAIPVIASGGGVNHLYVHAGADLDRAAAATLDSKLAEPTACNTVETVLVDREVGEPFLRALADAVVAGGVPVRLLVDAPVPPLPTGGPVSVGPFGHADLGREFLDATVGVCRVDGLDEAVAHIARWGSGHTEGVHATDPGVVDAFCRRVDAAALVVNGSLRLHDGPTLGLGPELAISTGRLHVRGPVTLSRLVTHSWVVDAGGTLRADADRLAAAAAAPAPTR